MIVRAEGHPNKSKHAGKVRGRWLLEQGEDVTNIFMEFLVCVSCQHVIPQSSVHVAAFSTN